MKKYLLILFVLFFTLKNSFSQGKDVGGVKFKINNIVIDSSISISFKVIAYSNSSQKEIIDSVQISNKLKKGHFELPIGEYNIKLISSEYLDIMISNVEVFKEKLTFVDIELKRKESPNDNRVIELKYEKPIITRCH